MNAVDRARRIHKLAAAAADNAERASRDTAHPVYASEKLHNAIGWAARGLALADADLSPADIGKIAEHMAAAERAR
jgi:hypothetical protein